MIREIFFGKDEFSRSWIILHVALILASVLFVFFFSTSTSPFYSFLGDDSAIFQAVGKGWAEGYLPYVALFENKGALIFLIDAIGYSIAPRVGIFLLQIPAMYLSMLFAWRALGFYLSDKTKFAAASFMLIFYATYYLDGNRTEEWSMPFLMAATYFFLRGLNEEKFSCPPLVGLINGVGFGACVLLRTTNALPLCCVTFLSAIFLLQSRQFKTLLRNVLYFCAGFAIIVLPFVIYFAAHDALYDALYGTILLNTKYTAQRGTFLLNHLYLNEYAVHVVIHFMALYLMIAASAIALIKNKSRLALSGLFCGAIMLLLLFRSSPYQGYCALITPLLPIFFAILAADLSKDIRALLKTEGFSLKRTLCKILIVTVMLYPLLLTHELNIKIINTNSKFVAQYYAKEKSEMLRLAELIPPEERNSVMIWGEGTHVSHWILTTGIFPRCRFFGNVKAFANVDLNVKREWFDLARANPPKWLIYSAPESEFSGDYPDNWTKHFRQNRDPDVEKLLSEKYELAGEMTTRQNFFRLYRLKDATVR